jgi:hypothetical protein
MSLAQVVYNLKTDKDFAAQMRVNPDAALARRGLKLSQEEKAFLSTGLHYDEDGQKVRIPVTSVGPAWI